MMRTTAHWLADRVARLDYDELSPSTLHAARRCIVDAVGCAAIGRRERAVHASLCWARGNYAPGESSVWFSAERLSPVGAAFVNACAASILDLDDGHRVAAGHPGAAIVPAVLCAAQQGGQSFEDVLLAIVAGYEAGVICARLRGPAAQANVATGRWSTIGVAAALSKLMRLDVEQTRHALTIAESHAPNLLAADHSGFQGGHVKEGIPWSVVSGYAAAQLALNGFTGYDEAFSNPSMYSPLRGDEDSLRPLVETTYYKRYACCRWMHSAIDAALQLQREMPANEQVRSILIETFTRAATLPNQQQPGDLIAAQFSVPFMVAAAWVRGADALLPADESLLADARIVELAKRVVVVARPEFDELYPLKVAARVTVDSGTATQTTVVSPVGDYDNPLADEALVDKAVRLSSRAGAPLAKPFLLQILAGQVPAAKLFSALSNAS